MKKAWKILVEYLTNVFTGGQAWRAKAAEVSVLGQRWLAMPPRYITVKAYSDEDEAFVREMASIYNNSAFSWFLYCVRERAVQNLVDKPVEGAQVNIGIIMAVDHISGELRQYDNRYNAIVDQKDRV